MQVVFYNSTLTQDKFNLIKTHIENLLFVLSDNHKATKSITTQKSIIYSIVQNNFITIDKTSAVSLFHYITFYFQSHFIGTKSQYSKQTEEDLTIYNRCN